MCGARRDAKGPGPVAIGWFARAPPGSPPVELQNQFTGMKKE